MICRKCRSAVVSAECLCGRVPVAVASAFALAREWLWRTRSHKRKSMCSLQREHSCPHTTSLYPPFLLNLRPCAPSFVHVCMGEPCCSLNAGQAARRPNERPIYLPLSLPRHPATPPFPFPFPRRSESARQAATTETTNARSQTAASCWPPSHARMHAPPTNNTKSKFPLTRPCTPTNPTSRLQICMDSKLGADGGLPTLCLPKCGVTCSLREPPSELRRPPFPAQAAILGPGPTLGPHDVRLLLSRAAHSFPSRRLASATVLLEAPRRCSDSLLSPRASDASAERCSDGGRR